MIQVNGISKPLVSKQRVDIVRQRPKAISKTSDNVSTLPTIQVSRVSKKGPLKPNRLSITKKPKLGGVQSKAAVKKLSNIEEAEQLLRAAPQDTPVSCGSIIVRFNHYAKSFPVYNGVVKWQDIDDEYCISFVYRGNYKRDIVPDALYDSTNPYSNCARRDAIGIYFLDIHAGSEYRLLLEEDPQAGIGAEGMRIKEGPILASSIRESAMVNGRGNSLCSLKSGNEAVHEITKALRSMAASDLQGDEAIQLRELRDLEDVLYS